jgi:hypothetical protein
VNQDTHTPHAVDNTDWLKTAAIILVAVDHIGYFFIEDPSGGAFSDAWRLRRFSSFWASRRPGPSRSTGSGSVSF